MKALVVKERGRYAVEDVPTPEPGPYDALVQMEACGYCNSTDAKLIDDDMFWAPPFPFILGHESVGKVVEVGRHCRRFTIGDRVTRPVAAFDTVQGPPYSANGGFSEFGLVRDAEAMASDGDSSFMADYNTQRQLVVPPDIDAISAALSISLAETASTLAHVPNLRERTVVVAGTGIAGLSYTLWATLAGARVITLGRRRERGELAERVGADRAIMTTETNWHEALSCEIPRGADLIIDAVGSPSLATKLQSQLNDHGTALVYGVASKGRSYPSLWRPARVEEQNTYEWVLSLIRKQLVDPQPFHSHTWPFAEIGAAIDEAAAGRVVKGIVTF